ncbi:alpha/beta hydrolase family esterase [Kitasatospora sp. NPDC058190]|uniref:extracellular catalytic domain type 1 short-chain-length polyhydroxyalkanoate depolymerase n=1 Tax=Kitasatospora sp. NPDC058190 TaxID=3346371 RepID=UPI0036DA9999
MLRLPVLAALLSLACCGAAAGVPQPGTAVDQTASPASAGCLTPPPVAPGETATLALTSGGQQRSYLVHVPAGYRSADRTPLVLAFHGSGESDTQIESYSGLSALDAIVLYPEGTIGTNGETSWEGAPYSSGVDDVRFVQDLLARTQQQFCVDQGRIYATGKSNGGGFTALLACRLPRRIAAFAPVAGAYYPETTQGCRTSPPVPMLEFHGTADPVIHYDGGTSHGEQYPSIAQWLSTWTDKDRCSAENRRSIGSDVVEFDWTPCVRGTEVTHYQVIGGGHTWPGAVAPSGPGHTTQTISATAVMWEFFTRHPLDRPAHPGGW